MKKLVLASAIAAATMGVSAPVLADGHASGITMSANASIVSDYRFRGISQNVDGTTGTKAEPAFQGGFDFDFGNGFYLGNWNSNVAFDGSTLEMDFYGGYAGEINGVGYDVGLLYYYYPGQNEANDVGNTDDVDTLEAYGSLSYYGFTLGLAYTLSDDYFGTKNQDGTTYLSLGYDYAFSDALSFSASIGQTAYDNEVAFNAATEGDYVDYSVGVSYAYEGVDFGLTYIDTDIDTNAALGSTRNDLNDGTVVFSVGTSF